MKDAAQARSEQEVEQVALRLLAMREHSRSELRSKLDVRSFDPVLVDRVLERLTGSGLLSDARFIEQYVQTRKRRGLGPVRIRAELQHRGIDSELIARWLEDDADEWLRLLREAHRKKFGSNTTHDPREIARQARFLQHRGFEREQVHRFLWRNSVGV